MSRQSTLGPYVARCKARVTGWAIRLLITHQAGPAAGLYTLVTPFYRFAVLSGLKQPLLFCFPLFHCSYTLKRSFESLARLDYADSEGEQIEQLYEFETTSELGNISVSLVSIIAVLHRLQKVQKHCSQEIELMISHR